MRKKPRQETPLPPIKLKYFGPDKSGKKPNHPGLRCDACGARDITVGSGHRTPKGRQTFYCEDCTIDAYQIEHGFVSRKAAAARRRRIFDVGYLFNELLQDRYMEKAGIDDVDKIPEAALHELIGAGVDLYNRLFTRKEKIALEETPLQSEIKARLVAALDEAGM